MILRTVVFSGISVFSRICQAVLTLRKTSRRARDMSGMRVELLPMPLAIPICIDIPVHRQPVQPGQPNIRERVHQKGSFRVN
jgi:hypothetical protein